MRRPTRKRSWRWVNPDALIIKPPEPGQGHAAHEETTQLAQEAAGQPNQKPVPKTMLRWLL